MGPPISVGVGLCLLFIVGGSFAGPLLTRDEPQCIKGLPVGKTFVYQYAGVSKIENDDVSQEVNFSADVVVSVPRECVLGIQLRNVVSPHQKFVHTLQNDVIEVRMDNGVIKGLKHNPDEPIWALNVKRAILSMLQAPLDAREGTVEINEKDVLGICKTAYTPIAEADDNVIVGKSKNLLSCEARTQSSRSIFFTPYDAPLSDIRTTPLAAGTYSCQHTINKSTGVIKKASCQQKEKLLLTQQATATPGVISVVTSEASLELLREEDGAQNVRSATYKTSCLIFDHEFEREQSRESLVAATDRYCDSMKPDVRPESGKLFGDLIKAMRSSSQAKISEVYSSIDNKPCDTKKLKSAFMDVLGMAGTTGSVEMIAKFIQNGEHKEHHQKWLKSLAYLTSPTQEMVSAMIPVVQSADAKSAKSIFLPVSAMANTLCKLQHDECEQVAAIKQLLSVLVKKLEANCSADRDVVVATLKALGNLGVNGGYHKQIMQCMNDKPTDIRTYTLRAFRKICDSEVTEQMLNLYADQTEDVEVRIGAYLNAIRCADVDVVAKIVSVYETEKIVQVGSFVYSHMRVIHESECPLKAELKRLLASFPVSSKFSNDPSKFSQNFEYSKFMDSVNMGGVADASVVFSPQSFLPRSASMNLSLDLFSQQINLLEVGGRIEGLEKILEQFLGRNGPRRTRRATKEDTDVARFNNDFKFATPSEKMAFYVNIFGNEVDFVEFNSVKELTTQLLTSAIRLASLHPSAMLNDLVLEGEIDIAKNALLVDNSCTTATISGLGLVLDMRAISNVALKASAPMPTEEGVMKASLAPSAVVQVDGSLTLSAGVFRHGARFTSTIHTSSVVDVEVTRREGEFKFRFNTPRDKLEILNAKSEVFAVQGDYETPIAAKNVRNLDGCTIQLPEIFGMSACITGTVPKPWYMAGRGFVKPYNFALTLEKTDTAMEGIEFSVLSSPTSLSVVLDTPGSAVDRRREIHLKSTDSSYTIRGQCPAKSFYFGVDTNSEDFVVFKIVDRKTEKEREYAVRVKYGLGSIFISPELRFEFVCPHLKEPLTVDVRSAGQKTEILSNYPSSNPLNLTFVIVDSPLTSVNMTISAGELEASSRFSSVNAPDFSSWHTILHTTYKLGQQKTQKFHYEIKVKSEQIENGRHRSGVVSWTSTCHPQYNHKIAFDAQSQGDNRKHKVQAWWGEKFTDEDKTIRIALDSKKKGYFSYGSLTTIQIRGQVYSPAWGLNYDGNFDNKIDFEKTPRITSELFIASDKKTLLKFDYTYDRHNTKTIVRASLIAPHTSLKFADDSEEISKGKYKGSSDIEWGFEGKKLSVDYTCDILQNGNHDLKLNIRAPNMKPIQHRQLVRIARDVELKTETLIDGKEYLVFELKREDKDVAFNFVGQRLQVKYSRSVKDKALDIKLDVQSKIIYTRPIKLVIHKDSPGKKSHELSVNFLWDAVANPDKKLTIDLKTDRDDGVKTHAKVTVASFADFEYKGSYVKGFIKGPNRAEFRLSGANIEARELIVGHTHSTPEGEGYLQYSRGGKSLVDAKVGHKFTSEKRNYYLTVTGVVNRKLTITRDLVARTLTVDLDRDGKLYHLFVDRKTDYSKGIIDCKITLNLPYENYASQELTVKGTIADGKVDVTAHYLSSRKKNYHFTVKGSRPERMVLDVEIEIKSDNEKLKEGKAHLKYNLANAADREILLTVERESNKIVDLAVNMKKGDNSKEMTFKLASEFTPSYDGSMKMEGTAQKFTSKTVINKNGAVYYTADNEFENTGDKMLYKGKYHGGLLGGDTQVAFEKNTLPGDNHRTYKLDIKRNERELKADAETQRTDGFKITSVNVCRTPLDSNCVSVTVKRNIVNFSVLRNNAINVKVHRKPDVTLEVDSQLHVPDDVHKAHVRLVGNVNEFKLGFDYHCDHSTAQVSEQSLRGFVVDRELLATRRREDTDKLIDIKWTAALDAKSDEKLEFAYRRDYNDKGYNSVAKLSHPKMRTPVVLKSEVSRGKDANSLYRVESELEFFRPEDTIYLHVERRINDEIARNKSIHIHVHKADKADFNLHVTLYRSVDLQKPVFGGYYWSYITAKKETRVGSLKAFLGEDLKGSIEFTSPYQDDFKITGEAKKLNEDGDKEAEIVHLKNAVETRGKISYNLEKLYLKAVVLNSDGTSGRELEVDGGRKEKGHYKLILSSFPEGKKTTDLGIEHTRASETSFHSKVYAPPEYLKRVAERAKEIAAARAGKYPIEDIKEELKTRTEALTFRLRKTFEDVPEYLLTKISQIFVEIQGSLTRLINNTTVGQRLKAKIEANREQIGKLLQRLIDSVRKCCPALADRLEKAVEKHLPKRTRRSVKEETVNFVEYVAERFEMFQEWLSELPPVRFVSKVYNKIVDGITSVTDSICRMAASIRRRFLEIPDVKQIAQTWAELYDSSSVGHMLPRQALEKYVIRPRLERYTPRVPVLEIDRKAGRFVADVDVPVDASKLVQYWAYGADPKEQQSTYEKHDFGTTMKMIRKTLSKVYDGQASVIDGKHFITFDGKHFSASGSCSYLLARDFANGTFSLILKNGDVPSYVLQFGDKYFEVRNVAPSQQRVTLNGQTLSTPMMKDGIFVLQTSSMVRITNGDIKFVLNTDTGVATIETRIWFFGKVAGLLGNYNREPSDDFDTPSGDVATNEKAFLKAWETETCEASEPVLFRERSEDVEVVEFCDKIFKSERSSLSLGFALRSAEEFHDLCLRAAQSVENKVHTSCQVAYVYLMDLERYANLPGYLGARLPDECRKYNFRVY